MDWNEERTATLRKLWLEGMSASQVARQLGGVSRSAVIGKVHRLGITVRDIPTRQRTAVRAQPRARIIRDAAPIRPALRLIEIAEMAPTANILGLETHSCRWPIGNPECHDFGFCGREKTARGSYCDEHARGAFRRLATPSEVKAWVRRPAARIEHRTA
ncbi:GcrA cell cycle regulator [Caulobacter sp. Root1455]|jgi:GcrA cell cycle regulator|uniref:GcrA family cell cycle regulator n=1 Tax=unclassified Caulobacter TaxID=2648921 RepID=UPI0006FF44E2|nr:MULTISPECIES: GcrA family cell cycle regulator [unclassified Caulobacter]KQY30073.1 GcrA cell cycle regulator [Caulobacter sp. Root487D2Y]KQY92373.1 GcrA cell cycle regulator [Caulobacter sp. Root1455]